MDLFSEIVVEMDLVDLLSDFVDLLRTADLMMDLADLTTDLADLFSEIVDLRELLLLVLLVQRSTLVRKQANHDYHY